MLLLIVVAVLSAIFGELRDAIAIFFVIVVIGAVEAVAEVRAKRALRALRDLSAPNALVRRAGVAQAIPVGDLVIGDVCSSRRAHSSPPTSASWRPTASQPTNPFSPVTAPTIELDNRGALRYHRGLGARTPPG
jgi:hypothetical protein